MHIPKYWAHSDDDFDQDPPASLRCWRWSDVSVDDARQQAETRGAELAAMLQSGQPLDSYSYGDRPMREQVVQSICIDGGGGGGGGGAAAAVITRNLYGSLVLNAARAMFIDVDFPPPPRPAGGLLGRMFRKPPPTEDPEPPARKLIGAWASTRPDVAMRVYRTAAGLRCLVTNRTFDPADAESTEMLQAAGSDPLYVRLCQAQGCFRARLTPNPWRCKVRNPPPRYPWTGDKEESRFHQWQSAYERAIQPFAVCRFLEHLGGAETHPEIAPLVHLHDQYTCADPARPLA